MRTLEGRRVALLEGRRKGELASLVQRLGGDPISAPAVREIARPDDFEPVLRRIVNRDFAIGVILTGAAVSALCDEADGRGLLPQVREALGAMTLVSRGPKPLSALKQRGLTAQIVTDRPHTSGEVLAGLEGRPLDGVRVVILHYGERHEPLSAALRARGAVVEDLCLYEWALPEDLAPIRALISETIARRLDAVLFTSQIQFRHLIEVARADGRAPQVLDALERDVIVGAVGPVCASALRQGGIVPDVIPALPNSVSLVNALADYFALTQTGEKD